MRKIILATTSQRRKDILRNTGINFEIIKPEYNEKTQESEFSYQLIESIAQKKGTSVLYKADKDAIIISADTVVVSNNRILGKPGGYDNAKEMLTELSGKAHQVVTSVCIIDTKSGEQIIKSETSEVTFNNLKEEEIEQYIKEKEPYDKAGSYGIQEVPEGFIKEIKGDYENIVGLPSKLVTEMLKEITKE